MKKLFLAITIAFTIAFLPVEAQTLDYDNVAKHPRILLHKGDVTAMKAFAALSSNARIVHENILAAADGYLATTPATYPSEQARLSEVSDEALKRIFYLSYAFVTTEDREYARRAEREMLAFSAFENWGECNSSTPATITMALAIGYDWLYNAMPVHSRSIIGTAIYEKGLRAAANFDVAAEHKIRALHNAGMLYGALATLERSPEYCKSIIEKSVDAAKQDFAIYEPYGVSVAGFGSWESDVTFPIMLAAALESALNYDVDVPSGFMRSAEFLNFLVAPSGSLFAYGDNSVEACFLPSKYWFAHKSGEESLVQIDEQMLAKRGAAQSGFLPLYMIFAANMELKQATYPNTKFFVGQGDSSIYIYRSGWQSAADAYFAIKGGRGVDAGSFVYEWGGVRWVVESGKELGEESYNCLRIAGAKPSGGAVVLKQSHTSASNKSAVFDVASIYGDRVKSATRTATIGKKDALTIVDYISLAGGASELKWQITTQADAEVAGPSLIRLSYQGKELYVKLNSKHRSEINIEDLGNGAAAGLKRVGYSIEAKSGQEVEIEVEFSTSRSGILSRLREKIQPSKR